MISQRMQDAFNAQINAELYSAYLYLSMAACFEDANLSGCANWMRVQAGEEQEHAMKFFDHITQRGGRVKLTAIEGPPTEWNSALEAFEAALEHEKKVTGMINDLMNTALEENDHAAKVLLDWFVSEQVEEEDQTDDIRQKLAMIGDSSGPLLMLDQSLAKRE